MAKQRAVVGRLALVAMVALVASGCSGIEEEEPTASRPDRPSSSSPSPKDSGSPTQGARFDPASVDLGLEPVAGGLDSPLGVAHAGDGSGRLFIVEQTGTIRVMRDGEVLDEPFLDVSEAIVAGGEQGLLGLAFHPDFARNGRFFIDYTDVNGDTVVAEVAVSEDPDRADEDSVRALLQVDQPYANHNGGQLAFGPDGFLYVAMGDGGSAGDPENNGQNTDVLLGKLLRLDVDSGDPYGIPDDNPFANGGGAPEIWAYGLRNPWRFSFDSQTGDLWIADVGQGEFEEVNRRPANAGGLNYGWDRMEGLECYAGEDCDPAGKIVPISGYNHDSGCSVTGGYVYRGKDFPELRGGYFFGDYCSGLIWAIDAATRGFAEPVELMASGLSISSFGLDEAGELYLTDLAGGEVLRVVAR
ncbi:MAG: PQQ-dependent sugar dehydrogenase [Actinomycetota bacterium]|nr:PQQ-dependent sugar dehydrogenase [Actinomycetota bacterium]